MWKTCCVLGIFLAFMASSQRPLAARMGVPADGGQESSLATVKGRLLQHEKPEFNLDFADLKAEFIQRVELPSPPVPQGWPQMSPVDRAAWVSEFEASDEGKQFLADRQKIVDSANRFELSLEKGGQFVLYDVPPGTYGLRGRLEKEVEKKLYVFEVFGQVQVSEDVEEVLLDPMMVTASRLLKSGEAVPEFSIPTFDGKAKIDNSLIADKNVLFSFWSMKSPPSLEFVVQVQQAYQDIREHRPLQLLSVCIDSDTQDALDFVKAKKLLGWHGQAEQWEHSMVNEFGVRAIPALFLSDDQGIIRMTQMDFQRSFHQNAQADLTQIVMEALSNKSVPTPAADSGDAP